jgi:hypothetical protein
VERSDRSGSSTVLECLKFPHFSGVGSSFRTRGLYPRLRFRGTNWRKRSNTVTYRDSRTTDQRGGHHRGRGCNDRSSLCSGMGSDFGPSQPDGPGCMRVGQLIEGDKLWAVAGVHVSVQHAGQGARKSPRQEANQPCRPRVQRGNRVTQRKWPVTGRFLNNKTKRGYNPRVRNDSGL